MNELKKDSKYIEELSKKYEQKTQDYSVVDKKFLDHWVTIPDTIIVVNKKSIENFNITYTDPCLWDVPGVKFTGFLPP